MGHECVLPACPRALEHRGFLKTEATKIEEADEQDEKDRQHERKLDQDVASVIEAVRSNARAEEAQHHRAYS